MRFRFVLQFVRDASAQILAVRSSALFQKIAFMLTLKLFSELAVVTNNALPGISRIHCWMASTGG